MEKYLHLSLSSFFAGQVGCDKVCLFIFGEFPVIVNLVDHFVGNLYNGIFFPLVKSLERFLLVKDRLYRRLLIRIIFFFLHLFGQFFARLPLAHLFNVGFVLLGGFRIFLLPSLLLLDQEFFSTRLSRLFSLNFG